MAKTYHITVATRMRDALFMTLLDAGVNMGLLEHTGAGKETENDLKESPLAFLAGGAAAAGCFQAGRSGSVPTRVAAGYAFQRLHHPRPGNGDHRR
jgi:hypothetical protein